MKKWKSALLNSLFVAINLFLAFAFWVVATDFSRDGWNDLETNATILYSVSFFCFLTSLFLFGVKRENDLYGLWIRRKCLEENNKLGELE